MNPCKEDTLSGVHYRANGEIYSTDATVDADLNKRLNLNCQAISLPQSRKKALEELIFNIRKQHTIGDINTYCRRKLDSLN